MSETLRISAQVDYAIRALADMASSGDAELIAAETVAERQDLPVRFLLAIMNDLRRAGILESRRGAHGGYRLARPPSDISLAQVIAAVDPPMHERPLHDVWAAVRGRIGEMLEAITIADVIASTVTTSARQ